MEARAHIVGAGMAGLACATRLAASGIPVTLYEATGLAGGRCRSWHDSHLDRIVDNGSHLLLSGNRAVRAYLSEIGAADALAGPGDAALPFLDLADGARWTLRPGRGHLPWWLLMPSRRVPGGGTLTHLGGMLRLARAGAADTVAGLLGDNPLYRRLWEPLAVSVLNTPAELASARLLARVLDETIGAGGAACRPLTAPGGLGAAFVDPALAFLAGRGAETLLRHRITGLARTTGRVTALRLDGATRTLGRHDRVVLALPPWAAAEIHRAADIPARHHAIVNAHFRLDRPAVLPGGAMLMGLVGGTAQWLFIRGDVLSVTVSAADDLAAREADDIAGLLWRDAARALDLPAEPVPPHRVVKERRATFSQTPDQAGARPGPATGYENLYLAGDWTDTGLPATVEGAIRSGHAAAAAVLGDIRDISA